jgi:hypothetical protein
MRLQGFGPVIAGFAAFEAVILAVAAESYLVRSLADGAILVALAAFFDLVTNHALVAFAHGRTITRNGPREK